MHRLGVVVLVSAALSSPALAQAPDVFILSGPSGNVDDPTATLTFNSYQADVTFECQLDQRAFEVCTSPVTYTQLPTGKHTFTVRARDRQGNVDPTPAVHEWTVLRNGCTATSAEISGLALLLASLRRRRSLPKR